MNVELICKELKKYQKEMYTQGKIDTLKHMKIVFLSCLADTITQEELIKIINTCSEVVESEKG